MEAVDTQRVSVLAQEDGESRKCGSVYGAGGHGFDRSVPNRGFLKVTGKSILPCMGGKFVCFIIIFLPKYQ